MIILFSARRGLGEIDFVNHMIGQITWIGITGIILWTIPVLFGVLTIKFAELFSPDQPKIIVVFLLSYYLLILFLRAIMLGIIKPFVLLKIFTKDRPSPK